MSMTMEDEIKRWTAKRKAALVMEEQPSASTPGAQDEDPNQAFEMFKLAA